MSQVKVSRAIALDIRILNYSYDSAEKEEKRQELRSIASFPDIEEIQVYFVHPCKLHHYQLRYWHLVIVVL